MLWNNFDPDLGIIQWTGLMYDNIIMYEKLLPVSSFGRSGYCYK